MDSLRFRISPRAGIILINTCSIRENAEQRIWNRLKEIKNLKRKNRKTVVGLTGCMAERLKKNYSTMNILLILLPVLMPTGISRLFLKRRLTA